MLKNKLHQKLVLSFSHVSVGIKFVTIGRVGLTIPPFERYLDLKLNLLTTFHDTNVFLSVYLM